MDRKVIGHINVTPTWKAVCAIPMDGLKWLKNDYDQTLELCERMGWNKESDEITFTRQEINNIKVGMSYIPIAIQVIGDMSKALDDINEQLDETEKAIKESE